MLWWFEDLVFPLLLGLDDSTTFFPLSLLLGTIVDQIWKIQRELLGILFMEVWSGWWLIKVLWRWFIICCWERVNGERFLFSSNKSFWKMLEENVRMKEMIGLERKWFFDNGILKIIFECLNVSEWGWLGEREVGGAMDNLKILKKLGVGAPGLLRPMAPAMVAYSKALVYGWVCGF